MKQLNFKLFATALLLFISTNFYTVFAQTSPHIGMGWTNENACSLYVGEVAFTIEQLADLPCIQVCLGSESFFWVTGLSQDIIINWTVVGGNIINQSGNNHIWIVWDTLNVAAGVYVEVIDDGGQVYEFGICVNVIDVPKALFSIKPASDKFIYCLEQEIFFVNLSTPNPGGQITGYHWDFGDGNTSNQFEPSHFYSSPGVYEVQLTVKNECYCMDTYTIEVTIEEMGEPVEISCPTVTCENAVETYTADAECEFYWSVEGGTILNNTENSPVVEVLWDNVDDTGFGWVTLELLGCEGCPVPSVVKVPIVQEKGHINGEDTICNGQQYRYSLPQWPATEYNWTLVDASGVDFSQYLFFNHQYNETLLSPQGLPYGVYTLRSIYFNTLKNCNGIAEKQITILDAPHTITGPVAVCAGESFTFETVDQDPNTIWTLINEHNEVVDIIVDTEFNYSLFDPGQYIIIANGPNRCDSPWFIFTVYDFPPTPQGIFHLPEEVCPGVVYEILFQNTDPNFDPNNYHIEWIVGNGSLNGPGNDFQIEAIFDENPTGAYTVSIRYKRKASPRCLSNWLVSGTISPVNVETDIEPFNPGSGNTITTNVYCTSTETSFRVDELDGDQYTWSISPPNFGSIVQGQNTPQITIMWNEIANNVTTGHVKLEIRKCTEWFVVDQFEVELIESPTINWTPPTQLCAGEVFSLTFSGTPTIGTGTITLDLGDGQPPLTPTSGGSGFYTFTNLSYGQIFSSSVTYTMQLTVTNPNGCFHPSIATAQVTVLPSPVATISPSDPYNSFCDLADLQSANIILTATEQGGIVQAASYQWYLNNINNPIGTGPTHQVTQFGNYFVVITGTNGCEGRSELYSISQMNCGGGGGPNQGSNCPETITVSSAVWTACNTVQASVAVSSTPDVLSWGNHPQDGMQLNNASNLNATYDVTKPGIYAVSASATWNNCGSSSAFETVTIAYQAQLDYSVVCDLQSGEYEVTLYNNSPFISGYDPQQTVFIVNGTPHTYVGNQDEHVVSSLSPGQHTFVLEISSPGYPVCTATVNIDLTFPDAAFTLPTQVCEGDTLLLQPTNPNPDYQYEWVFSGTSNLNMNTPATLIALAPQEVTLHVTDIFGCTVSHTESINVYKENFTGTIFGHEVVVCMGDFATLSYNPPFGETPPTGYQWYFNENLIQGATNPTYNAGASGLYGLIATDGNGCIQKIDPVSVIITPLPYVTIDGPNTPVCAGSEFDLEGIVDDESIARRWLREGVQIHPLNNTTTPWVLEDLVENTPGSFTYTLEVGDPANGDCTNSFNFTVVVAPTPNVNDVQLDFQVTCSPFEVVATIINPDFNGFYNWSNGDSGIQTTVNHTGLLGVRYTNEWGCSVWKETLIPALPEEHIWVFPTGCFESCEDPGLNSSYVIGPLPPYDIIAWLWDGSGNQYVGFIPPQYIDQEGAFQLMLGRDILGTYCELTSGTLQVTNSHEGCNPCKDVVGVRIEDIRIGQDFPYIYYDVFLDIFNYYNTSLTFKLTSPDGDYIPNTITLGPGQSVNLQLQFIPNWGFTGGNSTLFIQVLHNGNLFCYHEEEILFPMRAPLSYPENNQELRLVPNPALQVVNVHYTLNTSNKGTLTVYSLLGVALIEQPIHNNSGNIPLDLGNFSSGTYIVVIKDANGQRMQQVLIKK